MVEIVYIATGEYVNYFDEFAESLKYFWPGEPKILRILSDMERDFYVENSDIVDIEYIKIFNLFYPYINLHKTNFIKQLKETGAEYIFYFDADTKFIEVKENVWQNLKEYMDNEYFIISKHPFYLWSFDDNIRHSYISYFFDTITERNEIGASYIDKYNYTYVISSFFCGKRNVVKNICDHIEQMVRYDLKRENNYKLPKFYDENYFNKIVFDFEYNDCNTFNIKVGEYIITGLPQNSCLNAGETFLNQKGDSSYKTVKQ